VGKEFESIHDAFTGLGQYVYILTSVMMHCGTHQVSMLPVRSPSVSISWLLVCDYFAMVVQKLFVVIHKTMKVSSVGELRMHP
jgi:hypothetical protein